MLVHALHGPRAPAAGRRIESPGSPLTDTGTLPGSRGAIALSQGSCRSDLGIGPSHGSQAGSQPVRVAMSIARFRDSPFPWPAGERVRLPDDADIAANWGSDLGARYCWFPRSLPVIACNDR